MIHSLPMLRGLGALVLIVGAVTALSACESTQDKSARLGKIAEAHRKAAAKGLVISKINPDVKVTGTYVMHDQYGSAVAVGLKNTGKTQIEVPIAVAVSGARKKLLYRNNSPGLDTALVSMPVVRAGATTFWVDDQVSADSAPKRAKAKVGVAVVAPSALPEIRLSGLRLTQDSDGITAVGTIENRSKIPQLRLTVFVVAQKGGKAVAAGRAVVEKLLPYPTKKPVTFKAFFIGNPKGARLFADAPPTTLK